MDSPSTHRGGATGAALGPGYFGPATGHAWTFDGPRAKGSWTVRAASRTRERSVLAAIVRRRPEEAVAVDDRPDYVAFGDDVARIVDRSHGEDQAAITDIAGRCRPDLNCAAYRGRSPMLDADLDADRRLARLEEGDCRIHGGRFIQAISRGVASTGTSPLPSAIALSSSLTW